MRDKLIKKTDMVELVFKNDIRKEKMDALLYFLKVWDMDVEIKK